MGTRRLKLSPRPNLPIRIRESKLGLNGALPPPFLGIKFQSTPTHHHPLDPAEAHRLPRAFLIVVAGFVLHKSISQLPAWPPIKGQGMQVATLLLGKASRSQETGVGGWVSVFSPACPTLPHRKPLDTFLDTVLLEAWKSPRRAS